MDHRTTHLFPTLRCPQRFVRWPGATALALAALLGGACAQQPSHSKPHAVRPNIGPGATLPAKLRNAFFSAAAEGDLETVSAMLDKQPLLVDARPDNDHRTPLIITAWKNQPEMARLLIDRGADLESEDFVWGASALGWAGWNGQPKVAQVLIAAGAEVNHPNRGGCTPLCSALARAGSKYADDATPEDRASVIRLLREHGGVPRQDRTRPWPIVEGWDDVE